MSENTNSNSFFDADYVLGIDVVNILKAFNWEVSVYSDSGGYIASLQWLSPLTSGITLDIWFDIYNAENTFIQEFNDFVDNFDAEQYAVDWFNDDTVDFSLQELLDDANAIIKQLIDTTRALYILQIIHAC